MPHRNIIDKNSEDEVWTVIGDQLNNKEDNSDYTAQFLIQNYCVTLDIDIHPDSGDENGSPFTSFSSPLPIETSFRFRIEKQVLKHEIGKLFGMMDIVIGNAAFDKKFLIQSNNEFKLKEIFSEDETIVTLLQHSVSSFEIKENKIGANKEIVIRLDLEGAITEPGKLKSMFQPFKMVLIKLVKT